MLPKTCQKGKCFKKKKIFLFLIVPPLLCFLHNSFINSCQSLKEIQRAPVLIHKILLYFTPNDSSAAPLRQHTVCLLPSFCLMPALHSYTVALEKSRERHSGEGSLGKIPVMMNSGPPAKVHTEIQPVQCSSSGDSASQRWQRRRRNYCCQWYVHRKLSSSLRKRKWEK